MTVVTWILSFVIVMYFGWTFWRYRSLRKLARFVDQETFSEHLRQGQVIDVREPSAFHQKHILGARNIPAQQFSLSLSALRSDKLVMIYDQSAQSVQMPRLLQLLKKAGYQDIMVLKDSFATWTGKQK